MIVVLALVEKDIKRAMKTNSHVFKKIEESTLRYGGTEKI